MKYFVKVSSSVFDLLISSIFVIPTIILFSTVCAFSFGLIGALTVWFFEMFSKGLL